MAGVEEGAETRAAYGDREGGGSRSTPENVGVVVIHGVGDAELGWINDYIVHNLEIGPTELRFEPYSEVYRLQDTGRARRPLSKEAPTENLIFRSVLRRATLGDRARVAFAELHWADISRVGVSTIGGFLDILKLFFEAPHIIASGLLDECRTGIHAALRYLVYIAIWLLRWPITGMQLSVFGAASVYLMLSPYGQSSGIETPLLVMASLAMTAMAGLLFAWWRARYDTGLTSVGLATAIASTLSIAAIACVVYAAPSLLSDPTDARRIEAYLSVAGFLLLVVWGVWNVAIALANILIGAVGLWRYLRPPTAPVVPLRKSTSAAALAIGQGIIWKVVVCPLTIFLLLAMSPFAGKSCPSASAADCNHWSVLGVDSILTKMVIVSYINLTVVVCILAVVWLVSWLRSNALRRIGATYDPNYELPRLVVSPLILAFILTTNLVVVAFYYATMEPRAIAFLGLNSNLSDSVQAWLRDNGWFDNLRLIVSIPSAATMLLPPLASFVLDATRGFIHVSRDLVDHQYTPKLSVAAYLLPKSDRRNGRYPRRERIQARLHNLMHDVIARQGFDRLVFVTHSQGSVIMHDYLRDRRNAPTLSGFSRIDVVTLASPLTHLYQHYFAAYASASADANDVHPRLATWTNMWRVDDPLGNRVDIVNGGFIDNRQLGPGGHVDYWKESEVCSAIMRLIDPALLPPPTVGAAHMPAVEPGTKTAPALASPRLFPLLSENP